MKIALKFCGSCNPEVDLSSLASQIRQYAIARKDINLVSPYSPDIDLLVILCGCQRACADKQEIKSLAKHVIVTAGEHISGTRYIEKQLPAMLIKEIERVAPR